MQEFSSYPEASAADKDFLLQLCRQLDREISDYVYEAPKGAIGTPLAAAVVSEYLNTMRLCLVEPRWEEVNICTPKEALTGVGLRRMCVTMAEEESYVLVFDPVAMKYHLAWRGVHGLGTWGIEGNGVECFIAR